VGTTGLSSLEFGQGSFGRDEVELIAGAGHAHVGLAAVAQGLDLVEVGHDDHMTLHALELEDGGRPDGTGHAGGERAIGKHAD